MKHRCTDGRPVTRLELTIAGDPIHEGYRTLLVYHWHGAGERPWLDTYTMLTAAELWDTYEAAYATLAPGARHIIQGVLW